MTTSSPPRLDILPPAQQTLWPKLPPLPAEGFVLYGGTGIALRLGHRVSVDFNFFTDRPLDTERLRRALPLLAIATTLQDEPQSLTVQTGDEINSVLLSFSAPSPQDA